MVVFCNHCREMVHVISLVDPVTATALQKAGAFVDLGSVLEKHFRDRHSDVFLPIVASARLLLNVLLTLQVSHTGPDLPELQAMARAHVQRVLDAIDAKAAGCGLDLPCVEEAA